MEPALKKARATTTDECTVSDIIKYGDTLMPNEPVRISNIFWIKQQDGKCTPRVKKVGGEVRELTEVEKNGCWPIEVGKLPYRNEYVLPNGVNIIPLVDTKHMNLEMRHETTWRKINKKQIEELNRVLAFLNESMFDFDNTKNSCIVFPPGFLCDNQPASLEPHGDAQTTIEKAQKIAQIVDGVYNIAKTRHREQLTNCMLSGVETAEDFLKLSLPSVPGTDSQPIAQHILSFYHLLKCANKL